MFLSPEHVSAGSDFHVPIVCSPGVSSLYCKDKSKAVHDRRAHDASGELLD